MRIRTTSTQRTYRYVRLALIAATLFLAVGVGIELATGGSLPSVSAAYYTPAGPVFTGSLCAIALALLALSGRSLEQGLLDVAAVLALAVAFVPTTQDALCPDGARCVQEAVLPTVVNNAAAAASVVLVGAIGAVVLARVQGTAGRGTFVTIAVIVALVLGGTAWGVVAPEAFLRSAHNLAAVWFFAIVAAVAGLAAWRPHPDGRGARGVRVAYAVVAVGILLTLVALAAAILGGATRSGFPVVLVGESVALALFAVFWFVQTVELWNDPDPRLRGGVGNTPPG